jgi:DNA-binding LacI/PurR family transcriptional regulator
MSDTAKLRTYLHELAARAQPGDRLPTVRRLMKEHGLSQPSVQRVLADLKQEGLIAAHIGRGTFFTGGAVRSQERLETRPASDKRSRSVLILRRSPSTRRARTVIDDLQRRFAEGGDLTLEVAYSNAGHAQQVLQGLPRFDACIVQNSFEEMPIEMLAAIRRKTDTILVDGTWLVGTDIDAVGFEWGEPVERAVNLLVRQGHKRIGFVTTTNPFLANELGRQRYRHLCARPEFHDVLHPALLLPQLPQHAYEQAVVAALREQADAEGHLPFTAAIVWGIEDGSVFRNLLRDAGIRVPDQLSVLLLGRTDIEVERAGFFDMIGYSSAEQSVALHARLRERWADPQAPHALQLMPIRECQGFSIRAPEEHASDRVRLVDPHRNDADGAQEQRGTE